MIQILSQKHAEICSILHQLCFEKNWGEDEFNQFFQNQSIVIWGTWKKDILIGLLVIAITVDEAEIYTLCTHPDYRYKQTATSLIQAAKTECSNRLVTSLFLEVSHKNKAAISCYRKNGFNKIASRKNYYSLSGERNDALVMRSAL
ncbi:MAG: ribosomal-protein-alanine N-acetyltransferase [Alphaproteobacteria bacterium]|jgi:ribosomal-protein-alanine N-acetyltransferase